MSRSYFRTIHHSGYGTAMRRQLRRTSLWPPDLPVVFVDWRNHSTHCDRCFIRIQRKAHYPTMVSETIREISHQPFFAWPIWSILFCGIQPFGCILRQLLFVLNSVWFDQMCNTFGILFLVFALMAIISVKLPLFLCFFYLCMEDYPWWWRSFFTSAVRPSTCLFIAAISSTRKWPTMTGRRRSCILDTRSSLHSCSSC